LKGRGCVKIDKEKCVGCTECQDYCPVGAIVTIEWEGKSVSEVHQENCVECGVCLSSGVCPTEAIYMPKLEWPRTVRAEFSNPSVPHSSAQRFGYQEDDSLGRGTYEMKTNDVSGRFKRGFVGVALEIGRPGVGTTFRDIQMISMALAKIGVELERQNPLTTFLIDRKTGKFTEEILDERILSAIFEFIIKNEQLKEVLETVKAVSEKIDTVFSLDLFSRLDENGSIPAVSIAEEMGFTCSPAAKTNVGLGRPLANV
jgi:NAD-dependent dihydropyrimidine dehydrogenase PreA subunit